MRGREHDTRRRQTQPWRSWYKTARWQKARQRQLAEHPLCWMCEEQGRTTPATIVDHNTPHKGDPELFWDPINHGSLCKVHHDSAKQKLERTGHLPGCDASGFPSDPDHPWRK